MADLVPGRDCGTCNVCCDYYEIAQPSLRKPKATLCQNWQAPGGCQIYHDRPSVCREFYCLWRRAASLDDWWRPDRSGIVIRETDADIPPHYPARLGLIFDLAGAHGVIHDDRVIQALAGQIHQGVPVFLRIIGAPGFAPAKIFLNDRMAQAVASRDRAGLAAALQTALDAAYADSAAHPIG